MVLTPSMKVEAPEAFKVALETFRFKSPAQTPLRRSTRKRTAVKKDLDGDDVLPSLDSVQTQAEKDTESSLSRSVTKSSRKRSAVKLERSSPSDKKIKRSFAPPEQYAHLNMLQDYLQDSLDGESSQAGGSCRADLTFV